MRRRVDLLLLTALVVAVASPSLAYPPPARNRTVTIGHDGSPANSATLWTSMSRDGRFVTFQSSASNLVPGDTEKREDVFVHEVASGNTIRASQSAEGAGGDSTAALPVLSGDGSVVAFQSTATNLVPFDTNGMSDVFVRDLRAGTIERVSVRTGGIEGNAHAQGADLSADGRYIGFMSAATNIVPGDSNAKQDVFVHDRQTGVTERVSVSSTGAQANEASFAWSGFLSEDGRYVAFHSPASNLVAGDTNGASDIFVRDRLTGTTERVSLNSQEQEANGSSAQAVVSDDGSVVVFHGGASNLVPNDMNESTDIFVRDRAAGTTERVSVTSSGGEVTGLSYTADVSADGRYVMFRSSSTGFLSGDTNKFDVFLHDRETRATEWISRTVNDQPGNDHSWSWSRAMSFDGSRVAFWSTASNIAPGDENGATDAYVRDLGPDIGIGDLEASPAGMLTGWASLTGVRIGGASDAAGDAGPGAAETGTDLTGLSLVYRPEEEDILVRLDAKIFRVPSPLRPGCINEEDGVCYGGLPGAAGLPAVVYGARFDIGGVRHEVRALRAGGTAVPPAAPAFALYRCDPACLQTAVLRGGLGTTGEEVLVSVSLTALGISEGASLRDVQGFAGFGEALGGAPVPADEVAAGDMTIPRSSVAVGYAPAGTDPASVGFQEVSAPYGWFSTQLPEQPASGELDAWARACLGTRCGLARLALGQGAGAGS